MPEIEISSKDDSQTPQEAPKEEKKEANLHLNDLQRDIFDSIGKADIPRLKQNLVGLKTSIDFYDDTGMTPLQHAAFKGNKEAVQLILDRGANVNSSKHQYDYTALHFGALSGSSEVCLLLLLAGANAIAQNTVNRTPGQMAAFVGNKSVVQTINSFIPKSEIEYYAKAQGEHVEPYLPPLLADHFHRFVMTTNLHPVRIALTLQKTPVIFESLLKIKKVLELMSEKEMKRRDDVNEVMALKLHYLAWIVSEINRARDHALQQRKDQGETDKNNDFIELFTKKVLKPAKENQQDYLETTIRDCIREFPWRECTIFRQVVGQLVSKSNTLPAFDILKQSILGHNPFEDQTAFCYACFEENPSKKCSKCKSVQYCDRECQRLHWFIHKKVCARAMAGTDTKETTLGETKGQIDVGELQDALQSIKGS